MMVPPMSRRTSPDLMQSITASKASIMKPRRLQGVHSRIIARASSTSRPGCSTMLT
jgi:hypothetical protein